MSAASVGAASPRVIEGRYEIQSPLGEGGQGEVFAAWDRAQGLPVAVKILRDGSLDDARREFRAAATVRHPNLVAVRAWGTFEGRPYYVMDYVSGVAASEVAWGVEHEVATVLVRHCLQALDHLHARGLLHRDIKPTNIMLSGAGVTRGLDPSTQWRHVRQCPDLRARIADFGLLCRQGADARAAGSVEYLAPEILRGPAPPSADLYALGITLFELFTGALPAAFRGLGRLLRSPEPLPAIPRAAPWLSQVVTRLAAPYPEQRYPTARSALLDVERACPLDEREWRPLECELLGQEKVLSRIDASIEEVLTNGSCRLVQLVGAAGAGKSRVLDEIAVRASVRGLAVYRRGHEASDAPLGSLVLDREAGTSSVPLNGSPEVVAFLSRHYHDRLRGPSVLLLDDADGLDSLCLAAIGPLQAALCDRPILIVAAGRQPVAAAGLRLDLEALGAADVERLACGLTSASALRPSFAAQLVRHAGGSPGRVVEIMYALIRDRRVRRQGGYWSFEMEDVPDDDVCASLKATDSTRRLVEDVWQRDGPLLAAATTLGPAGESAHLAALVGPIPEAVADRLCRSGILAINTDSFTFKSVEVWNSCRERASDDLEIWRESALSTLPRGSKVWLRLAGQGKDPNLAVEALRETARRFRESGVLHECIESLERALERSPDDDVRDRVIQELAEALLDAGEPRRAFEILAARPREAPPHAGLLCAKALFRMGRNDEALALLRDLETACEGTILEVDRRHFAGVAAMQAGEHEAARDHLEAACDLARRRGDAAREAHALLSLAGLHVRQSRNRAALEAFQASRERLESLGDRRRVSLCLIGSGSASFCLGDAAAAADAFRGALSILGEIGSLNAQMSVCMNLSIVELQQGDLRRAREHCARARALADRCGASRAERFRCLNNDALISLRSGSAADALALLKDALDLARSGSLPLEEAVALGNIADAHVHLGETEQALRALAASEERARGLGAGDLEVENLRRRGEACLAAVRPHEARGWLARALRGARRAGSRIEEGRVRIAAGRMREAEQAWSRARREIQMAIRILGSSPLDLASALATLAFLPSAAGSAVDRRALDEALAIYERAGHHRLCAALTENRARALSRRAGAPTTRDRLDTLLEVATRLGRSLDVPRLLEDIVRCAVTFIGADRGLLFLPAERGGLEAHIGCDRSGSLLSPSEVMYSRTVVRKVWEVGEPLCVNDVDGVADLRARESVVALNIRAVLCVPLVSEAMPLGVLYLDRQSAEEAEYTPEDVTFLGALATHAAVALRNAQAHQALVRAHERLQELQDCLVKSERLAAIGEFAASMNHELAQPLSTVLVLAGTTLHDLDFGPLGPDGAKLEERWRAVKEAAELMSSVLHRLAGFARFESESGPLPLADVVEAALMLMGADLRRRGIRVEGTSSSLPIVTADRNQMIQVVVNLIANARDALEGRPDPLLRIGGYVEAGSEAPVMLLEDNGPGVPAELRKRIFDIFFTTKPPARGAGIGLAVVKQILQRHGATIEVGDAEIRGASFLIRFPTPPADPGLT